MTQHWLGTLDENCQVCEQPYVEKMYDAALRLRNRQTWANCCAGCFESFGKGLGTGRGQEYTKQEDGRWLKTGG